MNKKEQARKRRKFSIRKKISGTAACPRISVFRSNKHLYAQVINDIEGVTLAQVSSLEKDFADLRNTCENATKLGEALGERMKEKGIETAVFDRNGYLYHGLVKALADGVRKTGIQF